MKSVHLIAVGKLKDKNFISLEQDYLKRLTTPNLTIHEVKASADNQELESKNILKKINSIHANPQIILLTEFGKEYDSPQFSKWLFQELDGASELIFVICGAMGPSPELKQIASKTFSLSKLTFAHKLARIIFVEQFYRACTIKVGHPYHN